MRYDIAIYRPYRYRKIALPTLGFDVVKAAQIIRRERDQKSHRLDIRLPDGSPIMGLPLPTRPLLLSSLVLQLARCSVAATAPDLASSLQDGCSTALAGFRASPCGVEYASVAGTTTFDSANGDESSEDPAPRTLTHESKFMIGSLTKSFTCTLVGLFSEAAANPLGKAVVTWKDTIGSIFSQTGVPIRGASTSLFSDVTLKQLCEMRGGITDPPPTDYWTAGCPTAATAAACSADPPCKFRSKCHISLHMQRLALVEAALAAKEDANSPIGSYRYSNLGMIIVAAALEVKTGKAWEQLVQESIFNPLNMTSAGFSTPTGECDPYGSTMTGVGWFGEVVRNPKPTDQNEQSSFNAPSMVSQVHL
jgi:CubicO group peptidase (beta-lactamase class C family)